MDIDYTAFPVYKDLLPIIFAPPVRLSSEYADAWGLPDDESLDAIADKLYDSEWKGGKNQHKYVGEAAVRADLGNYSAVMRSWGAEVAAYLIEHSDDRVHVVDIGAGDGSSAEDVYKIIGSPERFHMTLLEPSGKKCKIIEERFKERGLRLNRDYRIINTRDIDIDKHLDPESQDIALQVAAVHHHRSRKNSFARANHVMKMDGHYVSVDWHSRLWMNPSVVFHYLLNAMEWPEKERGMKAFLDAYPGADGELPRLGHYSMEELLVFSRYWQAWNEKRQEMIASESFDFADDFFAMEGHCPIEVYEKELQESGFELDTISIQELINNRIINGNPEQIISNHNLVMGLVGQKKKAA